MRYRFEVTYQNPLFKDVSNLMRKCDMDMGEVCLVEVFNFKIKEGLPDRPIEIIKKQLEEAFISAECTVFKIEGGKIW